MKYNQLNNFLDLLKYQLIGDNSFIDFLDEVKGLIENLKDEIKMNKNPLFIDEFNKYVRNEINSLSKELDKVTPKINAETINKHFSNYEKNYYRIDDILKMDKESKLYSELCFPHDKAPCIEFSNEYYNLQNDFLRFTKEYFINDIIDYFNEILRVNDNQKSFPYWFETFGDFENFLIYSKKHVLDPFIDYSYLIQRMKHEKRIKHIIHREIMIWLKDNEFINEKDFDKMLKKGSFSALSKFSPGSQRENNYNIIFN